MRSASHLLDPFARETNGATLTWWSAELGSKSSGIPVVSGGVVYVGTNNFGPLAAANTRGTDGKPFDGGVLVAFRADNGSLLWQRYSSKLVAGRVNDWPGEGLCSSPFVEPRTQRLWYCTNRCEVVCLDIREAKPQLSHPGDRTMSPQVTPASALPGICNE